MELRLVALYPEQMNIYADRGNILFLRRRCEWRGIGFSYCASGPGDPLDPTAHDLIYRSLLPLELRARGKLAFRA